MRSDPRALLQIDPTTDRFYGLYEMGWFFEPFVLFGSLALSVFAAWRVFRPGIHRLFARTPNPGLGITRITVLFAALWFYVVMTTGAASDIVGFYVWLYVFLSLAAFFVGGFLFPLRGLYFPADVQERANLAAGLVFAGFALGTAFAFGGALTGEGPGWWVVVVFFLAAYLELRGNMAAVSAAGGGLWNDVRLERDASAGLLLGAVALASGIASGRAAAGDFLGWGHALRDYTLRLWPLIPIAIVGATAGALSRNSERKLAIRAWTSGGLVAGALLVYFLT